MPRSVGWKTSQIRRPASAICKRQPSRRNWLREVASQYSVGQLGLEGIEPAVDVAAVVAETTALVIQETIDIPRVLVVPQGEVRSGYHPFTLDLSALRYPPVDEDLWIQHLRTGQRDVLSLGQGGVQEARLEDTIVSGLVDYDDVAYDQHADLLYDLAGQTVEHFRSYLPEDEIGKVLRVYQKPIVELDPRTDAEPFLGRCGGLRGEDQQGLHRSEAQRLHGRQG